MRNKGMFTSGQIVLELKEEQVLLRIGAVMELKIRFFQSLQTGKKVSNGSICTLYIGNISILCRAIYIK